MADLIDRAALYEKIQPVDFLYGHDEDAPYSGMAVAACDIESAQAVDAELVKHGEWIGTADGYADGELVYDMWECSQCGYDADGADEKPHWNYCPNCGAKMDGGKET